MLAGYREKGVLRRLRTTPVGPGPGARPPSCWSTWPWWSSRWPLILAVARIGFGVPLPRQLAGFVLAALLAAAALIGVGLFIAAVAPTGQAAKAIGDDPVLPADVLRRAVVADRRDARRLRHISHATPLGAAVQALQDALAGPLAAPAAAAHHWPPTRWCSALARG